MCPPAACLMILPEDRDLALALAAPGAELPSVSMSGVTDGFANFPWRLIGGTYGASTFSSFLGFLGFGFARPSPTRSSRKASYSLSIVSRSLVGTKLKTAPGLRCLQSAAVAEQDGVLFSLKVNKIYRFNPLSSG